MRPLRPLQEVQGYVAIYAVMERFGYGQAPRAWRKLLFKHHQTLPDIVMMQFPGQDGRRGRLVPAVHVKDLDRLILHLENIDWHKDQVTFVRPAVEQVLQVVAVAFQDHHPEAHTEVDGVQLDLLLKPFQVALLYCPLDEPFPGAGPVERVLEGGVRVLTFDPDQEGFHVGHLIFQLRRHVEGEKA